MLRNRTVIIEPIGLVPHPEKINARIPPIMP